MLVDLENKIRNIGNFSFVENTKEIVQENVDYIISLLQEQISQGKDGNGNEILLDGNGYRPKTVAIKTLFGETALSRVVDRVTLYMTGEFYESMYIVFDNTSFDILSNVPYFEELMDRTGLQVMKLSIESLNKFKIEILNPELKSRFNLAFNGN